MSVSGKVPAVNEYRFLWRNSDSKQIRQGQTGIHPGKKEKWANKPKVWANFWRFVVREDLMEEVTVSRGLNLKKKSSR